MNYEKIELEKLKYAVNLRFSREFMAMVEFDDAIDGLADLIGVRVRGHVFAESESVQRQAVSYPVDWWHALKERWFPEWAKLRWPVKYRVVILDVKAIYPTFVQKLPDHLARLMIVRHEGIEW